MINPMDSDIIRYKEIRKLTTEYITGCLFDYDYIKNRYRFIAVDLSRHKELDAHPKSIQQIEFGGQLKIINGINAAGTQSMFVITILEKIKEINLKLS